MTMSLSYHCDLDVGRVITFPVIETRDFGEKEMLCTVPSPDYAYDERVMALVVNPASRMVWLLKDVGLLGEADMPRIVVGTNASIL